MEAPLRGLQGSGEAAVEHLLLLGSPLRVLKGDIKTLDSMDAYAWLCW